MSYWQRGKSNQWGPWKTVETTFSFKTPSYFVSVGKWRTTAGSVGQHEGEIQIVIQFLRLLSVDLLTKALQDAANWPVDEDDDLERLGEQLMNQKVKQLVEMIVQMWRVVLVLQAEIFEQSMRLLEELNNELKDESSKQDLTMEPRVKALDGQGLGDDEKVSQALALLLRLHIGRSSTTALQDQLRDWIDQDVGHGEDHKELIMSKVKVGY